MNLGQNLSLGLVACLVLAGCGQGGSEARDPDRAPPAAPADETSRDFGDYVLHFNAISTDQLDPKVAKQYDIVRSKNRAMLNVSIVKKVPGTTGQSVSGSVSASAANLTGQLKTLNLREVQEGGAVYFIADLPVANGETLIFNIDATPINETSRFSVRFSSQFFAD